MTDRDAVFAVISANLNWGRPPATHAADLREIDVRMEKVWLEDYAVLTQETLVGGQRERAWLHGVTAIRKGSLLGSLDRLGFRIRFRRIVWRLVEVPTIGRVKVVCVHMPPRRMGPLYAVYAFRLRRLLSKSNAPWIVGGDWNVRLSRDPAQLRKTFGGDWRGPRIDGFHVHPKLAPYVRDVESIPRPKRFDNHPFVILTLGPKKEKS